MAQVFDLCLSAYYRIKEEKTYPLTPSLRGKGNGSAKFMDNTYIGSVQAPFPCRKVLGIGRDGNEFIIRNLLLLIKMI
jgi:hypothetical protein